ncbi:MAG: class I SAM-dependent methyltransferase, partial [Leptospirillia bacterium]
MRQRGHPVFAGVYDLMVRAADGRLLGPQRRRCVASCRGRVLEIGAGTGASFPYWLQARRAGTLESLAAV